MTKEEIKSLGFIVNTDINISVEDINDNKDIKYSGELLKSSYEKLVSLYNKNEILLNKIYMKSDKYYYGNFSKSGFTKYEIELQDINRINKEKEIISNRLSYMFTEHNTLWGDKDNKGLPKELIIDMFRKRIKDILDLGNVDNAEYIRDLYNNFSNIKKCFMDNIKDIKGTQIEIVYIPSSIYQKEKVINEGNIIDIDMLSVIGIIERIKKDSYYIKNKTIIVKTDFRISDKIRESGLDLELISTDNKETILLIKNS